MFSRRNFLRGFAGALVALPVLEALPGRRRRLGAEPTPRVAKRFIAIMTPDGVDPEYWFPTAGASEDQFTLSRHLSAFEPLRGNMILMRGLDNRAGQDAVAMGGGREPHAEAVCGLLTGHAALPVDPAANRWSGAGQSIDQWIAQQQIAKGYLPRLTSVDFCAGSGYGGGYGTPSYVDVNQPTGIVAENQLFDSLFGNPDATQEALAKARERQKSILDGVAEDYASLVPRVSGEDRLRIQAHLDAIREIELRLDSTASCSGEGINLTVANDDERRRLQFDLLIAAMTCEATHVASVSFYHEGGGGPQLPFIDVLEDIHELSHGIVGGDTYSREQFNKYQQWINGCTLECVQKMQAVNLPDGKTLFDETVIFSGSGMCFNHGLSDLPHMILAGKDTPFRTGRYVQLPPGTPHTKMLATIGRAFGNDLPGWGADGYNQGHLDTELLIA